MARKSGIPSIALAACAAGCWRCPLVGHRVTHQLKYGQYAVRSHHEASSAMGFEAIGSCAGRPRNSAWMAIRIVHHPSANGRLPREPLEDCDHLSVCEAGRIAEFIDGMRVGKAAQPQ